MLTSILRRLITAIERVIRKIEGRKLPYRKVRITMSITANITAGQEAVLSLTGVDKLGIETGVITDTTATVDNPAFATVTPVADQLGYFTVAPIAQTSPVPSLTVNATLADPATGLTGEVAITFEPGAPVSVTPVVTETAIPS